MTETTSDDLTYEFDIPISRLNYDETRSIYVSYQRPRDAYPLGTYIGDLSCVCLEIGI